MSFVAMLLRAPVISAQPKRAYNQNKVKPKHKGSLNRYRLYLEGQRRTIPELAELMGYTYDGTRSTVDRMVRRGQVTKLEYATNTGMGRKPALYTWVK